MKHTLTLAVMTVLLTIGLSSAVAHADSLTLTLTHSTEIISGQAGGILTYEVTASAPLSNGAPVNLISDAAQVGGTLSIDDTDYINNAPFFIRPGGSFTFDLFTITVPANTTPGIYSGFFTITGGADGAPTLPLGKVNFVTNVTPEPSSFLLLGSGLAGLVGVVRRKRAV